MCKFVNNTKHSRIDKCMKPLIKFLKEHDFPIIACCCGHGKYPMTIVANYSNGIFEILTNELIERKRNFYKQDKEGIYFIPEVMEKNK